MFKIICDLVAIDFGNVIDQFPDGTIAPAVNKYNKIIAYKNCKPCSVGDIKLTSTSSYTSEVQAKVYSDAWTSSVLSPVNANIYRAYEDILDQGVANKFNLSKFKHISLLENDQGFATGPTPTVTQLCEIIIDSTQPLNTNTPSKDGYKAGYKESFAKYSVITSNNDKQNVLENSPFFESKGNNQYTISKNFIAYTLRIKGALTCPEIKPQNIGDGYFVYGDKIYSKEKSEELKFLEIGLPDKVREKLFKERDCKINDNWIVSIVSPEKKRSLTAETITNECQLLSGKLESEQETVEKVCAENGSNFEFTSNRLFSVKCDNYKSYIQFSPEGEILSSHLINTAYETQLSTY